MIRYDTGVCEINAPFARALCPAVQQHINCSPAPDLVFSKLVCSRVFSGGAFSFHTDW